MIQGQFSIDLIGRVLADILPALQRLHDRGQLHGDITPQHISWNPELSIYQLAPSNSSLANPVYGAPEQLQGQSCAASDLYSLGVSCIHLLTGIHPFELMDLDGRQWVWRDYWLGEPGDNLQIAAVLDRLIQPDLDQRYPSATAAIDHLTQVTHRAAVKPPGLWSCTATLRGHSGVFAGITSLAINYDSGLLASASEDKTIRLWDLATGQTRHVLTGHQGFVEAVAFQPGAEKILASGGRDKSIEIWDGERVLWHLHGHTQAVNTVAFRADGQQLASGSSDRTIKLWDVQSGQLQSTLSGHKLKVTALAFSCLGILASASADGTIGIWRDGIRLTQLVGHVGAVTAVAFSPDGQLFASGGEDRSIRLWATNSWTCQRVLAGHPWLVSALAFAPAGDVLLSGSWDKTVKFWQVATGREFEALVGHTDSVTCLAIDPSGQRIFTGSRDRSIKIWQVVESNDFMKNS